LKANSGKPALSTFIHKRSRLRNLNSHNWTLGTTELVRFDASLGPQLRNRSLC
jgi:hypothetical protein